MTSEKTLEKPCSTCGDGKGKLQRIVEGWGNSVFRNEKVENIAKYRALRCATCDFNKDILDNEIIGILNPLGIKIQACTKCYCPINQKTRSMDSKCEIGRWDNG